MCLWEQPSLILVKAACPRAAADTAAAAAAAAADGTETGFQRSAGLPEERRVVLIPSWRPEAGEEPTSQPGALPSNATPPQDLRR